MGLMKTTAIIAEFNPFHNGHAHLIRHAKEDLSSDLVLIIMSGNFVQRGEPAVFDKFQRTLMALSCGADLVFELPAVFATSAAREFAMASVALADKTGVVDQLLFGTEGIGDLSFLSSMADTLLQEADFVSLHTPLTTETRHLIGARELSLMKPTAMLINTARGAVIDETALADALRQKRIAGAALDVFENEPHVTDVLYRLDNVVLTPHVGTGTIDTRIAMAEEALANIRNFFQGTPTNVVN